jgi:glutamate-5-semialdehyde dehydrogenase
MSPPIAWQAAKRAVADGALSGSLFKRLDLNGSKGAKYEALLQGLDDVARLEDPAGMYGP